MIRLKMNYNNWFFNQYKYLKGKDGAYNDTKWVNAVERYKALEGLETTLFEEQPFGLISNNDGIDKLLELLGRSNYTFEDINSSLIDTYNVSLKNAMGKMLVNTQSVMFHTKNTDKRNVFSDKSGKYYIVEAPFNQLHFGYRDEFIRQRLHDIHTTENDYYMDINTFNSKYITDVLGFTIMCTVNGMFCNDCKVCIDDKGFKFKIRWSYSTDVDFIIYKLDKCFVREIEVDASMVTSTDNKIPASEVSSLIPLDGLGVNYRCLLNIHDPNFDSSTPTCVNFGLLSAAGLSILNIQNKTLDMLSKNKSNKVKITIYALRYFHEVPNLYPCTNYYDMINSELVYDDKYEKIKDSEGNRIVSVADDVYNKLEVCTPPISLDRSSVTSFNTVTKCFDIEAKLYSVKDLFVNVGITLNTNITDGYTVQRNIIVPLQKILAVFKDCYITYGKAAALTAIVPLSLVSYFGDLITSLEKMLTTAIELFNSTDPNVDFNQISKHYIPEMYGNNFDVFVIKITKPFHDERLSVMYNMKDLPKNFFVTDNSNRFNRPVSEQCFITLRYNFDEDCFVFDYPSIRHFNGISNTFYINENVKGDEVYKFFVLYTDTDNPAEKTVDKLTEEQVFDFDKFVQEVNKHMGYIRYWNAENKLLKYSKILFNKYDQDTCIQILSKILKHKLEAKDILQEYPSEIEYELSAIQSFNYEDYDADSPFAPFAVNYLFYTLSMMHDNEDKLQTYFMNSLVGNKFNNRFVDVDISKLVNREHVEHINLSTYAGSPTIPDMDLSVIPETEYNVFYGLPGAFTYSGNIAEANPYRNVFDVYVDNSKKYLIDEDDLNDEYYVTYDPSSINTYNYLRYEYNNDIGLAKILAKYMTMVFSYEYQLQTSYAKTFNQKSTCESAIERCNVFINDINKYITDNALFVPASQSIANMIVSSNPFITLMESFIAEYDKLVNISYAGNNTTIFGLVNDLLSDLRRVFHLFGYDNYALKPIRAMYIHLKRINKSMNLYEFRQWVSGIDYSLINEMNDLLATNPNIDISPELFPRYAAMLEAYILQCHGSFAVVIGLIDSFDTSFWTAHMYPIANYCISMTSTYTYDMYALKSIEHDDTVVYATKPKFVILDINTGDPHFANPTSAPVPSSRRLMFYAKTEEVSGGYKITSIRNICEYCMFDGTDMTNVSGVVKDKDGNTIQTLTVNLSFIKVGSSADNTSDISELISILDNKFDFQNVHEVFDLDANGRIVNAKRTPMNYEMFVGNKFFPLESVPELILDTDPHDPAGPIDRLTMSNQKLNAIALDNYANHDKLEIYFKPSHVKHPEPDQNDVVTSIGGKYAVGQRIYIYAKNTGFIFPATVTRIDASEAHGLLEADVDSYNSKWYKLEDSTLINEYFMGDVECEVIDDNISNFIDEFSDESYQSYYLIDLNDDVFDGESYKMPGDPIYVTNNAPYIYNRINYFFNENIPNRFIDEEHKMYHMRYIGCEDICEDNKLISINMISHDFNEFTEPELFPILRTEPNDHEIWDEEKRVFGVYKDGGYVYPSDPSSFTVGATHTRDEYAARADEAYEHMETAETDEEYRRYLLQYENYSLKAKQLDNFVKRLEYMIEQPEQPTTWYNVYSYNATEVYVHNGRSKPMSSFIPNVNYLTFTDKVDVFIYDWEHKMWIDPTLYSVSVTIVDGVKFNQPDNFKTDTVPYKLDIQFDPSVEPSRKLLVYFGYNMSDIFDTITLNDKTCYVRFKPIISTTKDISDNNIYSNIRIRKHFDGCETYAFDEPSTGENISVSEYYKFTRPDRSGKYMYAPELRMCNLTAYQSNNEFAYTDFELYIKNPFVDITTTHGFKRPSYNVRINQPIDSFVEDEHIKLICVSNGNDRWYDGNVSSIMFEGVTSDDNGNQVVTITKSSLDNITSGEYICTVFESPEYASVGGLITVKVTTTEESITDGDWVRVPDEFVQYHELPKEFIIVPKPSTINTSNDVKFEFKNEYVKYSDDTITSTNDGDNPFEYYYDSKNDTKLPLSNTRNNNPNERLVVDTSTDTDIKLIKSTYIGIARYSLSNIPKNGFIDVTGYVPSPLSRDRYEFYVNGRNITHTSSLNILSPTTIQLTNLRSLKNFELIELVDDMNDSDVFKQGPVYVALNGDAFSSYRQMALSNKDVTRQDIKYVFNVYMHDKLHDYTNTFIDNPNNVDDEEDILSGITETQSIDYRDFYNLPSINGIQLMNIDTKDIGLIEIPPEKIYDKLDNTWKREILTNPFFNKTHYVSNTTREIVLHTTDAYNLSWLLQNVDDVICAYITGNTTKYFTLYISNTYDGVIDDVDNTLKIIPFVKCGTYVLIDKSYAGKYLHATYYNANVITL